MKFYEKDLEPFVRCFSWSRLVLNELQIHTVISAQLCSLIYSFLKLHNIVMRFFFWLKIANGYDIELQEKKGERMRDISPIEGDLPFYTRML